MTQLDLIQDYYGKVLATKDDLKTTACCAAETIPSYLKGLVGRVHQEVSSRFYGCGVPIPPHLDGTTILDLGSGTGRDCFVMAGLTGPGGKVIGVDMTDEQIGTAKEYIPYHRDVMPIEGEVEFRQGYIEDLEAVGLGNASVDVVVSNCVINLSPDKDRVFKEIFRVLKPGGELYFSDVFVDRRLPSYMQEDKVLLGECLGGALYIEDFRRSLVKCGIYDYRVVGVTEIAITNEEVKAKVGNAKFYSMTIRAFNLPVEDRCEDYGQVATYKGSIEQMPHGFFLDDHHYFVTGKPMTVCSNTASMLTDSRYGEHFDVVGDTSTHYGLFDCGDGTVNTGSSEQVGACC